MARLLVLGLGLAAACPFSRFAELDGLSRGRAQPHQRRLLDQEDGRSEFDAGAAEAAPAAEAEAGVPAGAPGPSIASAGAFAGESYSAGSYSGEGPLRFYKGPTTPDGKADLGVIFNTTNVPRVFVESTHRIMANFESFFNYSRNTPDLIRDAVAHDPGRVNNQLSGTLQEIQESLSAMRQQGGLALEAILEHFPSVVSDHLEESVRRLQTSAELAAADPVYQKVFKILMLTVNPGIYGLTLRLAFHDAGSHNPNAPPGQSKGGANGSIRFEFDWPSNGGLQRFIWPSINAARQIVDVVMPGNSVGFADLIAICGAMGTFQTGGPFVNVGWGRPDALRTDPFTGVGSDTNESRDYPIAELLYEWDKFGFNATELTVLSGAHGIGIAGTTNPQGRIGGRQSLHFGKQYYKNVRDGIAFFGSDKALYNNPETRKLVDTFADSDEAYFAQWAPIYARLTMLGVDPSIDLHTRRF